MRPSEYIARGVRLRPLQTFRASIGVDGNSGCALTAFLDGIAGEKTDMPMALGREIMLDRVPGLRRDGPLACAAGCPSYENGIFGMVIHLNDTHRWTRERIGEWLDTQVEKPKENPVEEPEPVTA